MKCNELAAGDTQPYAPGGTRNDASGVHRIANAAAENAARSLTAPYDVVENAQRRACLLVIEDGAEATSDGLVGASEEMLVMIQSEGEPSFQWAQRIFQGLSTFDEAGMRFEKAIMLIAARFDSASMTMRHVIARALLNYSRISRAPRFEILLLLPGASEDALRDGMLTLSELVSDREGGPASVHVLVGGAGNLPFS